MELYMMNRQHGRMIFESVENGPLIWPTIVENGVTRPRKYFELTLAEAIQVDCDVKANKISSPKITTIGLCTCYNHGIARTFGKNSTSHAMNFIERNRKDDVNYMMKFDNFCYKKQGDDPIDAINHMMSFLSAVITSRYPTTNNQLRNSSNPRQQAIINDRIVTLQPVQWRQISFAMGTTRTYTSGASGSNSGK
ncbi:hypothetical protein Tco_0339700 [Tanacetum coccineum]